MDKLQNTVILYFHGSPGGPDELAALSLPKNLQIVPIDRLSFGVSYDDMLSNVRADILKRFPDKNLHLIGFSMGAMAVLQLGNVLGDKVMRIDLVSAATPLELGHFLAKMAGRPVFDAAMRGGVRFSALCKFQAILLRFAPALFFKMLFASAAGEDRILAADPTFKRQILKSYTTCLTDHPKAYADEIRAYVQPWAKELNGIDAPIHLWNGGADNWTPIEMAYALRDQLGPKTQLTEFARLSHYSTLAKALPLILGKYND